MSWGTNEPTQLFGLVALSGTMSRGCTGKTWPLKKSSGGTTSQTSDLT